DIRFSFFFFQAEDGIRDDLVTGVQTCALPILNITIPLPPLTEQKAIVARRQEAQNQIAAAHSRVDTLETEIQRRFLVDLGLKPRSEERRVGKECRSRRLREN